MHQETWDDIKVRVKLKGRRIANRALLPIRNENTCGEPNWRRWCRCSRWADHEGDHEYIASARDGRIQTRIRWANPPGRNDTEQTNERTPGPKRPTNEGDDECSGQPSES